jgi:hypothetical protein
MTTKKINEKVPFPKTKASAPKKQKVSNDSGQISNGLTDAILGYTPGGSGVQLSQLDTLFKNNRWYMISNMRQLLSEIYVEHGLIQTVVDVPVDDGLRGGVDIRSKQLSAEQVEQLQIYVKRQNIMFNTVGQALKWNRLYGGAGIVIITDQDPSTPLDLNAIKPDSSLEFRAVDMWELFWDKQSTEGYDVTVQEHSFEYYSYYGTKLHRSRVLRMKGLTAPSFIRPRLRGWGYSVVESMVRSINQYLKANDLSFEVLDEFKIDVFKIKGLTQTLLSANGTQQVQKRVALTNQQKNYQNAITMDAEDDYIQKQLTFAGLADTMQEIRLQIAADMRMPQSKLFGESATGFGGGQDSIENYNAMVEAQVREKAEYEILRILEISCQKLFGFIPDDLTIKFKTLRVLTADQEETVKTQKFNRLYQAVTANLITHEQFVNAVNAEQLLGIQLDVNEMTLADEIGTEDVAAEDGQPINEPDKQASKKE